MATNSTTSKVGLEQFRSPRTVVGRFVVRRTLPVAIIWAFIFSAYTASKVLGYTKAYPTIADRAKFAHTLGSDSGMNALLGTPHKLVTVNGYTNWTMLGVLTLMGGIWALLLATKYFRGEEETGRSEILLTGQTTPRQATASILSGLYTNFTLTYVIVAAVFISIGKSHDVGYGVLSALFFALATMSAAAIFLAVGALMSQLMPTRTRASAAAAGVFALSLVVRAFADMTSAHWLLDVTPLGWIEKLQPLVGSQPMWLLPIFGSVAVLSAATVWIAGRRDLGDSIFADHDTAIPHTRLLNAPLPSAIRLTRATTIGWMTGITFMGYLYGSITKAVVQTLNSQSKGVHKTLSRFEASHRVDLATIFLGVIYLVLMTASMAYVANAVSKVRDDEAKGYADNFLVEPISRLEWLGGRILCIGFVSLVICLCASIGVWAGQASVHTGVPIHTLLEAGANMTAPVLFTLGVGVLAFGLVPRLTAFSTYGVLGWSFLITLVASGTNLSHWILDTSLLHQTKFAPAVNPDWTVNAVMIGLGLLLGAAGMLSFNARDLETE